MLSRVSLFGLLLGAVLLFAAAAPAQAQCGPAGCGVSYGVRYQPAAVRHRLAPATHDVGWGWQVPIPAAAPARARTVTFASGYTVALSADPAPVATVATRPRARASHNCPACGTFQNVVAGQAGGKHSHRCPKCGTEWWH